MCIRKLLKIKRKKQSNMNKDELINETITYFTNLFDDYIREEEIDAHEITDDVIKRILIEFFDTKKLTDAERMFYDATNKYIEDTYDKINWDLDREEVKKTPEFKQWDRHSKVSHAMYYCYRKADLIKNWVTVNGKTHTEEESATIAADKWCELLFKWHLQDNGAINETHAGGFPACALATILGNDAKETITDDVKVKAHDLFKEYYLRLIHYSNTYDCNDLQWLKDTLPDKEGDFDWKYGFEYDMYCDYDPSYPLYLILYHSGVPDKDIHSICPWKTGISIRTEDNAVMYRTYQHKEEI